jgi:hypothetical protein
MLMLLVPLFVVATVPVVETDTSFSVPEGSRLAIHNFAGTVIVRPGPRNVVRIQAVHPRPIRVLVSREGASYDVRTHGRHLPQPPVDYRITAPASMSLDLEGFHCDMDIDGWKSDVLAETVRGAVRLRGGQGLIRLSSMTGGVDVSGAKGRMQLSSVESGVGVHDAAGEISIEAVNGNVVLDRVRSRLVEAATVSGDVQFTGWIDDAGRYRLTTHRGNLDVLLPPEADATVQVSTFSGGFQSAFPVRPGALRPGRVFSFTLGAGRALMDLQSFEGRIRVRQGEPPVPPGVSGAPGAPLTPPPSGR